MRHFDIAFTPKSIGPKNASLIISDGTPTNASQVKFFGTGIEKNAQITIEDIIDFFDSSVFLGNIVGTQTGSKSTSYKENTHQKDEIATNFDYDYNRLNAFRNMMLSIANKIDEENFVAACDKLSELYNKTDGYIPPVSPPDFIYGISKVELANMIAALRQQFECNY